MATKTADPPTTQPKRATARTRPTRGASGRTEARTRATLQPPSSEDAQLPRYVGELKVVNDEPMPSPLPTKKGQKPIVFNGFRMLELEDQSVIYGCGECPDSTDFTGSRGEVRQHRVAVHGMNGGGAKKAAAVEAPGFMPMSLRMMPLGELLSLAAEMEQIGDVVVMLTTERDEFRNRALAAEQQVRRWERAFTTLGLKREDD